MAAWQALIHHVESHREREELSSRSFSRELGLGETTWGIYAAFRRRPGRRVLSALQARYEDDEELQQLIREYMRQVDTFERN